MTASLHGPYHIAPYFLNGLGPHCDGIGDSAGTYATLSEAITHAHNLLRANDAAWAAACVYIDRPQGREILWERGPLPFRDPPERTRLTTH
ncbi:MAG TPA: hypothetical protein VHX44_19940 [Planctomycetota bacterium]|nr:hypothetical protein [Planctomycetota bacterium]